MKRRIWTTALAFATALAFPALPAWAQGTAPSPAAQSGTSAPAPAAPAPSAPAEDPEALIRQGLELRRRGEDAAALALFERAYAITPTPRALAQRALAEQALGSWVIAEQHLLEALAPANDPWIASNRPSLQAALSTIQERLASVILHGGVDGAEVKVNGQSVGKLPLSAPIRVVAGTVVLDVTRDGYYALQRQFVVNPGDRAAETVAMTPRPAASGPSSMTVQPVSGPQPLGADPGTPTASSGGLPPVVFWIGLGTTVALGGVSVWSGLDTVSKNDDYEEYTGGEDAEFGRGKDLYEDAKSSQDRTNILIGATAVVGVGTVVIALLTDFGGSQSSTGKASSGPRANLQISEHGAGFSYAGSF